VTRYELIERIGVGAMAEIFRGKAVAAGGFEKPVAIKRILPHLGQDRRFVEALMAEAKILSQLRHRNIVQIFDVGLGDDGQYFLVMEFVDGLDLADVQRTLENRRKRFPLDLTLHVGAEICEALEHAHCATAPDGKPMRLVHRDVAPSNVLVSRHGEVKLTDFGLARRPEEVTQGGVRGKFGYLSPEAAAGIPIDTRSDVFSAAVVVYELALGRRLFSHLPDLEAVRAVYECNVPRPRDVDPGLPAALDEILMAALVRDPTRRLGSAGQLGAQLRSLRYSLEESAGDPSQELARVIAGVEAVGESSDSQSSPSDARKAARRRRAPLSSAQYGEPTVLTLTSLDPFSDDRDGTGLIKARAVLDRFEEEETRLASQPGVAIASSARWREPQDTLDAVVAGLMKGVSSGNVRETAPTGIFVGEPAGAPSRGETQSGRARPITDDGDESTRVVSPAQLARRINDAEPSDDEDSDDRTKMVAPAPPRPRIGAGPQPSRLPGMPKARPAPPPLPAAPPAPAKESAGSRPASRDVSPVRVEAYVPARGASPTVSEPPGGRAEIRATSLPPVVAGFDRPGPRRIWLIALAVLVMVLAAGITAALLR